MNTDFFLKEIEAEAWKFDKISLQEMDGVKLMDRVDVNLPTKNTKIPII